MTTPRKVRVKPSRPTDGEHEAIEHAGEFLEISNLGPLMRGEIALPEMLIDDWLQKGVLHWMQGAPGDGKSWVALKLAVLLLQQDDQARVLIMDGEAGAPAVAVRLRTLGLDADTAEARVTHVNMSEVRQEHFADFVVWARFSRFTLAIWDPVVHWLASAGLSEDSNDDFATWMARVVRPLLARGQTHVGVDHVPKAGETNGYPRGASGKKGAAHIVFGVSKTADFDRETIGEIKITVHKNKEAAVIPKARRVMLGGDPQSGKFVFRDSPITEPVKIDRRKEDARRIVADTVTLLEREGRELAGTVIAKRVQGNEKRIKEAIRESALSAAGPLIQRAEELEHQTRLYYSLRTEAGLRLGPS